ncbi:MAG: carbonic anhydrase [Acidobacteria bacterium]|nr:MAG: carbonic anhydrase [Acidobacteriota bacterium]
MDITEETLVANRDYTRRFTFGNLAMPPSRHLAVLACMDARLTVEQLLGLKTGEAHIIRNAGGLATEDALRSLIISHHLLGTKEFIIINHTDCGMLTFKDEELKRRLVKQTGKEAETPLHFHAFTDLERNVREQVQKVKSHPWLPGNIPVRGFIYDVKTGKLEEVHTTTAEPAARR